MTNGAQTGAYREKLTGYYHAGHEPKASHTQFATPSLRPAFYRANANVRTIWLHLPPDQYPD